jgi:hypothetical protein
LVTLKSHFLDDKSVENNFVFTVSIKFNADNLCFRN